MRLRNLSGRTVGWMGVALTVTLWVAYAISMRGISFSSLTTLDVAFIRFVTPTVLLAFLIPRTWQEVRQSPRLSVLLMAIGGGLPFYWLTPP